MDPVFSDSRRCEFRLDQKVYLSNLRLADLGCTIVDGKVDDGGNTDQNTRYASHLGAYSLIDRIVLLNNTVEIAELRSAGQYLAFANLQRTNANAFNVVRTLNKSSFALDVGGYNPLASLKNYNDLDTSLGDGSANVTTPSSYLDLTLALPFLKATPYLLGTEMQNLRLVIEWVQPTAANYSKLFVGTVPTGFTISTPTLLIDEVIDPKKVSQLKNKPIQYINMDHEVVNVNNKEYAIKRRLRGFDDRTIRRMLVMNQDTTLVNGPSSYFGGLASNAQHGETYQFTLNGQKMLPYAGIENEQQKLAMLNDVFGTHILPQGAQYNDLIYKASLYSPHNVSNNATKVEANNLVGQMSYGGFAVNSKVNELQLEYGRQPHPGNNSLITDISSDATTPVVTTLGSHNIVSGQDVVLKDISQANGYTGLQGDQAAIVLSDTTFSVLGDTSGGAYVPATDPTAAVVSNNFQADGTTAVANNLKVNRSNAAFNILFWGEVVKVMTVSNNQVSISIV
jgi:hypothetical protein